MKNFSILYEDNHVIVVIKEPNIPTQADESKDMDMLTMIKNYIKEKYDKPGNVYLGLVHRLDRPVGGVMIFAKTSKAASRLSDQIKKNELKKTYIALVHGKMDKEDGTLENYLLKDENTHMSKIVDSKIGKKAILNYSTLTYDKKLNMSLIEIELITGRHHQIRVQFSYIDHPIYGDQKYGIDNPGIQIHLWAYQLSFMHPVKNEMMTFKNLPIWAKSYIE